MLQGGRSLAITPLAPLASRACKATPDTSAELPLYRPRTPLYCTQILEECGYDVPVGAIHEVTSYLTAIGISGSRQTIFAAEVDDAMAAAGACGACACAAATAASPFSSLPVSTQ